MECCPLPELVCDSISASKTKCGFSEFGTASSPPKKYLTKTQSGGLIDSTFVSGDTYTNSWSGALDYSRPACTTSDTRQLYVTVTGGCSASITLTGSSGQIEAGGTANGLFVWDVNCAGTTSLPLYGCSGPTVISTTVTEYASPPCGAAGATGSTVTLTLSNEYTTALLISDTEAALPSYPGTYSGTCSSLRDLSSSELTYTIRRFKYKFILPDLTGIACYELSWLEGSTPMTYTWNGTDTETPVYGPVDEPATNGTVEITAIVADCAC